MKNKHPQMYSLNETARREILEQFVARYIDHVSPEHNVSNHSTTNNERSHDVASEILAIGPIQVEGINIEAADHEQIKTETGNSSVSAETESKVKQETRPSENIMIEMEETDSEMLLVK